MAVTRLTCHTVNTDVGHRCNVGPAQLKAAVKMYQKYSTRSAIARMSVMGRVAVSSFRSAQRQVPHRRRRPHGFQNCVDGIAEVAF
jgi:hypothetical protein